MGGVDIAARSLPLNDDWVYAEPTRRLATGHGLHLFPEVAVPAIPQISLGALAWVIHPSFTLLRLETLVLAALTVVLVIALSQGLGAGPFWSVLAGAALATFPVFAGVSASFMTEPMYLALLLGAALVGTGWLRQGRRSPWLPALLLVAALDRQHALGIPAALSVGVLLLRARRTRADLVFLAVCWLATIAGLAFPALTQLATPRMAFRVSTAGHSTLQLLLPAFAYTPRLLGLLVAPFGLPLARAAWGGRPGRDVVAVSVVAGALALLSLLVPDGTRGTYLTVVGLGPVSLPGDKPQLLGAVLPVLKLLSVAAFTALVAATYRRRRQLPLSPALAFLVVLALTQAIPMLTFSVYDRYYLPVVAILLPVAAAVLREVAPRRADVVAAMAVLLVLLGVFAAGEQDFIAWQAARDALAHRVMAATPSAVFFGGYETYGTYTLSPMFEAGHFAGPTGPDLPSFIGPPDPQVTLAIAGPGDPRPGLDYGSLAPGRVVLVCPRGPCPAVLGH